MRNIIFTLFLLAAASVPAGADGKTASVSTKVLIYYYYDATDSSNYKYYSHIIAESVVKELKNTTNISASILPETQKFLKTNISENERKHYIEMLKKQSIKYSTRFIITGSYTVVDDEIRIQTQVFDALEKNFIEVRESRAKIGASFVMVVNEITAGIHVRLSSYRQSVARYINEGDTFYGAMAWSFGILSASGIGSSIYFYKKTTNANNDYDKISEQYNNLDDEDPEYDNEASQYTADLESKQKDIDKYKLYRNISFGATGTALVIATYYTYKYISSRKRIRVSSLESQETLMFVPVCGFVNPQTLTMNTSNLNEFYYGGLVTYRF